MRRSKEMRKYRGEEIKASNERLSKIDGDAYHLARIDRKVGEGKKRILAELGLEG